MSQLWWKKHIKIDSAFYWSYIIPRASCCEVLNWFPSCFIINWYHCIAIFSCRLFGTKGSQETSETMPWPPLMVWIWLCNIILKKFYSCTFKSNVLRFEVGMASKRADCLTKWSFCAGKINITISWQALIRALHEGEMVKADGGYYITSKFLRMQHNMSKAKLWDPTMKYQ